MITYWKYSDNLSQIDNYEQNCWVNVNNPSREEITEISETFNVPLDLIHDILDVDERPRVELEDDWLLVIIRIPIHYNDNGVPYITIPLGVLISNDTLITITLHKNEIISNVMSLITLNKADVKNKSNFLINLFLISSTWYLRYLKQINFQTNVIEQDLEKSTKNEELHRLLKMEKCLVYFITSLKSNEILLTKLKNFKFHNLGEYDEDLLEDAMIENKQAVDVANIYSDILSGMMDAFASVISNNLNIIMKQLTSITILLMIPTLIASLFGMNIPNHMEKNPWAFFGIFSFSLILSIFGLILFRKKKWF